MGHVQIQANIGIEVRTIENGDVPVERHPQRETKAVERVPLPSTSLPSPPDALRRCATAWSEGSKHAAGESFGMTDELLAHFLILDLQTAKVSSS